MYPYPQLLCRWRVLPDIFFIAAILVSLVTASQAGAQCNQVALDAQAQEIDGAAQSANCLAPPRLLLDNRMTARRARAGWSVFGGETAFLGTAIAFAAVVPTAAENQAAARVLTGVLPFATIGLTAASSVAFMRMAERRDLDGYAGWGAAGIWPGAMEGIVLAAGIGMAVDADLSVASRLALTGAGALLGGVAGYYAFRGFARARGRAGGEIAGFWVGFFASEVAAFALLSGAENRDHWVFLSISAGAVISTLVTHGLACLRMQRRSSGVQG